jgi:Bacterial Ig-like domain (group 1)/Regulator of chromosome condensation (RCC1) repeat/Bacterial Ig-like domain (group 2)
MRASFLAAALPLAAVLLAACDDPANPGPDYPPRGEVVSGELQHDTVGQELPQPVAVRVTDQDGDPLAGQTVSFAVTAGVGSLFAAAVETGTDGVASTRWRLGTVAGDTQRVEARIIDPESGGPVVLAAFRAVGLPDAPAVITAVAPATRSGTAGRAVADSLRARVTDAHGNAVPGVTVVWSVAAGGGTVSPGTAATDAQGIARTSWTLGLQIGTQQAAEASLAPAVRAQFTAVAQLPLDASLVKVSGDGQTGTVGTALPQPAVVELRSSLGQPIAGAAVTWTPAASSGTVAPPVSVTGPDGRASAEWTLGTFAWTQGLAAATEGAPPVTLSATAVAGPAATLTAAGGDGQNGEVAAPLAQPLAVRALDAHGNAVAGLLVTWTVVQGSGSVVPTQSSTDAEGVARTRWTLGQAAGPNGARAAAAGLPPVQFTATGHAGATARVVVTPDSAHLNAPGGEVQLHASTVDAYGNATGTPVTWTSLDPGVATVRTTGVVRGMAPGLARVVAQSGAAADTARVTVAVPPGAPTYVDVAAGGAHACGLADYGTVFCWGSNSSKQLGVQSVPDTCFVAGNTWECTGRPQRVAAPVPFRQVAAGFGTTCALSQEGRVYCWGAGWGAAPVPLQGLPPVTVVRMQKASDNPCGLTAQGTVHCWTGASTPPVAVPGLVFAWLGEGGCGVTSGGDAYCWTDPSNPQPAPGGLKFKRIARANVTCGITVGDETVCWEGPYSWTTPRGLLRDTVLVHVDAGDRHACGLRADGAAFCWGTFEEEYSPVPVDPPARIGTLTFSALSSGRMGRMGLDWWMAFDCGVSGGDIYCRGGGKSRQTGRTGNLDWGGSPEWSRIADP